MILKLKEKEVTYHLKQFFNLTVLVVASCLSVHAKGIIYDKSIDEPLLPISYLINGGFDVAQNGNWFNQKDFGNKSKTVWNRVRKPVRNIKADGGFSLFLKDEFLSTRAAPNLLLHTLGGAYDALWLKEYYDHHQFRYPIFMATLTSYIARWGNEVLEATEPQITSHDHIADLYFFDTLGILLSLNENYMKFLVDDLGMKAWHSLPFYDPDTDDFINAGLNYIVRPRALSLSESIMPFFYFGMQNIVGLSINRGNNTYSFGSGFFLTDPLKRKSRLVSSFFYEKNNDLAFSVFVNGSEGFRWRTNFYPLLFKKVTKYKISFFLGEKRHLKKDNFTVGLSLNIPVGLGTRL